MHRALLALIALLILAPNAAADTPPVDAPGQHPMPQEMAPLMALAQTYWQQQQVQACPVTAWAAPTLVYEGVTALGQSYPANCEMWVTDEIVHDALQPETLQRGIVACFVVVHELGHSYGLMHHGPDWDLMSGSPENMALRAPEACWEAARVAYRVVLHARYWLGTDEQIEDLVTREAREINSGYVDPAPAASEPARVHTYRRAPRWP